MARMRIRLKGVCCGLVLLGAAGLTHRAGGQGLPAPTQDRVGFPANYRNTFVKLLTVDRQDNGQIRVIWGNAVAAATPWWERYPYGSVLLFESYGSERDANNNLVYDANGRLIPTALTTIFVKRKEPGFGSDYRDIRNGEWEFVAYRPDGSTQTAPAASGGCAACHLQAGGPRDWTFRRQSFAGAASGAAPTAAMAQYSFVPRDLTVKAGTWSPGTTPTTSSIRSRARPASFPACSATARVTRRNSTNRASIRSAAPSTPACGRPLRSHNNCRRCFSWVTGDKIAGPTLNRLP